MFSFSENSSITYHDKEFKYNELRQQVEYIKSLFSEDMPSKDDVVAICLKRTPYIITQ